MLNNLSIGDRFPGFQLPGHTGQIVAPADFTTPSLVDIQPGFGNGYPLMVVLGRGFFCLRDQQQFRRLCNFQRALLVNYVRLISVSADAPGIHAAFRARLGAERICELSCKTVLIIAMRLIKLIM